MSINELYENEVTEITEVEENEDLEAIENSVEVEEPVVGVVTDCLKLYVRESPEPLADAVCIIDCLTEVEICMADSTDEFYKVYLSSGIEGYCMKKYIAIRP